MKLSSVAYMEGFYYRPRIDKEVLQEYGKGLLGLSGCLHGEIASLILEGKQAEALRAIKEYQDILGRDNFYLELQDHTLDEEKKVNRALVEFSETEGIPVVATNDVHYVNKEDAYAQEILLCIGTQKTIDDPNRLRFSSEEFYLKTPEEMKALFREVPEACKNTQQIAEKCNLKLNFNTIHLPEYKAPRRQSLDKYLESLCVKGVKERYPSVTREIKERMNKELSLIKQLGFAGYFLIVWDFIQYARRKGIPVGPGRGSGAGSLVAYLLGITDIDPLKYGLLFERFLNPNRKSMPDLDIDFADTGRDMVIDYVKDRYGQYNVAQIATFGSMKARAVIRDVGRVLGVSLGEVDRIAKLIPHGESIFSALQIVKELKDAYKSNKRIRDLLEIAQKLEGLKRHMGVHAAGIVIAKGELTNYVPYARSSKGIAVTQYEGDSLVKLGLLKMDFLGLRTLTVIDRTVALIREYRREKIKISEIPLNDPKTFELLSRAETVGVFQLESIGMRDLLKKLKPTEFSDLVALLALYRPGPINSGMLDDFIQRKHGHVKVVYEHPLLEPILRDTYGVIIYQEQVMRIATDLAGFTPAQADILRRAMGKKIPEEIERERGAFLDGAQKNGIEKSKAQRIFSLLSQFGAYGFNKSHSCAYAMVSYQTAYLKANYPLEFMCALLSSEMENTDKVSLYVNECSELGLELFPPCIQKSEYRFRIEGKGIRFGMGAIKNVGQGAIESILQARREGGRFSSLYDFCQRVDLRQVNKKVLESLIMAGAFDALGHPRSALMEILDQVLSRASKSQKDRMAGQTTLFDTTMGEEDIFTPPPIKEWHENQLLAHEKDVLGFYLTGHPLARYARELKNYTSVSIEHLKTRRLSGPVVVGGIITHIKLHKTKADKLMAVFKMEDLTDFIEIVVFPRAYAEGMSQYLKEDELILVRGDIRWEEDRVRIMANEIIPFKDARQKLIHQLILQLSTTGLEEDKLIELKEVLSRHPGNCDLKLLLSTPHHGDIEIKSKMKVSLSDNLLQELENVIGREGIHMGVDK